MSKQNSVLITGSSGFFGRHLVSFLRKQNYKVYTLSQSDRNANFPLNLSNKNFDISNYNFEEIETIVHCAFQIPKSKEEDNETLLETNKTITDNSLKLAKKCSCLKNFIHLSSIAVYPIKTGVFDEQTETNPHFNWNTNYGLSKLYAEEKLTQEINVPVSHLRISQLLDDENYTDSLTIKFKAELKEFNQITVFGNKQRANNFIRINYLAEIIEKIIKKPLNGVFNTGEKQITYFDLAKQVAKDLNYNNAKIGFKFPEIDLSFNIETKKLKQTILFS